MCLIPLSVTLVLQEELDGENGELRKKISSDIKLDLYNYGKKKAIK
jgi:hypothetical protein